ncbi:putative RNA-directed DNA polymerase [Helianthus annuus]|uniref:Putative zinc finger, CCHC-type n=1 Tax=Helianthus annuus TaxID=4232 RepID=A0A251VFN6_HELAN|nr:putative RNA-directed DNA polymerase [Helianthus annuus]
MAGSSSNTDTTYNLGAIAHMITTKLNSSNHHVWRSQMLPIFSLNSLLSHIDGSSPPPAAETISDGKPAANPLYAQWLTADQKAVVILHASLSEEALSEVIGLSTARQKWLALESAFCNTSIERIHNLRDQLRLSVKGNTSVSEFGRKFKSLCDQLSAIGHPVDETDKLHWFLCGLGASFETFSTAVRASKPPPPFRDLIIQAENHELFLKSLHGHTQPVVAFNAHTTRPNNNRNRGGGRYPRGSGSGGRGRGRRPPHCQLCRIDGHYANSCPSLHTFASKSPLSDSDLAKAFHAQCHVTSMGPDWTADSGASDHMSNSTNNVTHATPVSGDAKVTFGNGPNHQTGSGPGQM